MQRSWMRAKHWPRLSNWIVVLLLAASISVASGQTQSVSRPQNQPSAEAQNQDQNLYSSQDESRSAEQAQGADQVQAEEPVQDQNGIRVTPPPAPDDPESTSHARIVRISYVDGEVRIDHGRGYESVTMNVPVTERNWLQTRSDGWVEVQFEDGSMMRLAPDTVVAFTELSRLSSGATVTTVDLDQGEAVFKITQREGNEFQVTVKNKSVVPDGSALFRVTSINSDPLEVVVWKGEVAVRDSESGGEVAVKKNETFLLDASDVSHYALDKGAEADSLDQWSKERDDYLSTYARGGYSQSPYQYGTGDLNYYGGYFDAPGYGMVWQPNGVGVGWDPFANGYWSFAPGFGYTWVSSYPWGWLPFRYGHWAFINGRGWCWVPGSWHRWHTGPTWVNAPPGFRPPVAPTDRIVITGGPGGRVARPGTPGRGNVVVQNPGPRPGNKPPNHEGDGGDGFRRNRRVFTNDDVQSRVPRTDVPTRPAPGVIEVDRKPAEIERQPAVDSSRRPDADRNVTDRQPMRSNHSGDATPPAQRPRVSGVSPEPRSAPTAQPAHQSPAPQAAPPARNAAPPPQPQPVHQSPPAASPAPARQSAPQAESHSRSDDSGSRSRPK